MCSSFFATSFSGQAVTAVCASVFLGRLSRRTEICAEWGLAGVEGGGEGVARTSRTGGEGEAKREEAGDKAGGDAEDL